MIDQIIQYVKAHKLIENGDSVIAGVSGGADSVCLLKVLIELSNIMDLKVTVVHVHHGIRGEEADRDMNFVENLCNSWNIMCKTYRYNIPDMAKNLSISCEEAGRQARYEAFSKTMMEINANKIAVAHNANDNAETIIMNMVRGTGIKGMCGIPIMRECIIRPLLNCTRDEIEKYLADNNIEYVTDSTNLEEDYTRNKVRRVVLPYICDNINDRAVEHINNMGEQLSDIENYLESIITQQLSEVIEGNAINKEWLKDAHIVPAREAIRSVIRQEAGKLKDITNKHIEQVYLLAFKEVGSQINLPYNLIAITTYDRLIIRKNIQKDDIIFEPIAVNRFGTYELKQNNAVFKFSEIYKENVKIVENRYTKCLDYDILNGHLRIRTREIGDYIVIDSEGRKKSLKSYYIDMKIPKEERDNVLVLADEHEILWVIGYRIGENYKVTEETHNIVRIQYLRMENNNE